jgi:hypothetical protein
MKANTFLFILPVLVAFLSCSKENTRDTAEGAKTLLTEQGIDSLLISFGEQLPENSLPVCLRFDLCSQKQFSNSYTLVTKAEVKNNSVVIRIDSIRDNGKCPYPVWSSLPVSDSIMCAATGSCMVTNLKRGTYTFEISMPGYPFAKGTLAITDQTAVLACDPGLKGKLVAGEINIVPDSSNFGTYNFTNGCSDNHFADLTGELKKINCRPIALHPGRYRAFEVGPQGAVYFNSGQTQTNTVNFIFKTDLNISMVLNVLDNFIKRTPEAYGFIFRDSYGQYYNIKRSPY